MGTEPHRFFPPFRLDRENAQLWRGGQEIRLRRKTFDVLLYLVDHPSQLVTKAALLDAIWAEVTVSDWTPATCVAELRKALGDEARVPRFIETVHGRGYRFIAKVETPASLVQPSAQNSADTIMVGRRDELAQLRSRYSRVVEGQRQAIFVTGEAGIGKSTFVQAFLDSIAQEGSVRIARGQCVQQYGAGEPYMPVLEGLSRLGQEPGGDRLIELLNRFAPTWLAQMPALLTREERTRLLSEIQGVTQQRMLREMTQALEALATEAPLMFFLEDLHWSDFSTLELIASIARRSELARLLILGTYRPVEILANDHPLRTMKQELELHHHCEELRLKLLTEEDVEEYLAKRVAKDASRRFGTLAPVIHDRTDGNPLFMVNMVDYLLVEGGALVDSEVSEAEWADRLRAHRLDALRSIRHMIERNLERLKPEEQAILEGACLAGTEFSSAAVAAALECSPNEVEGCCKRLARHEQFVSEQGSTTWPDGTVTTNFRFHHSLYQEVLYGRLPMAHRFELHRRIAIRLEAAYSDHAGEIATELAHHYSSANSKNKAIHYFRVAGDRSVGRGAIMEAEDHYRGALKLLIELPQVTEERDQQELTLQISLGTALLTSENWSHPDTTSVFARAEELAKGLGENSQLVSALLGLLISCTGSGRYRLAREIAERMLRVADVSNDPDSLSVAHTFLGETLMEGAQYVDARNHLELGSRYCEESESSGLGGWGLIAPALLSNAFLVLGFPDRARALAQKTLGDTARYARLHKLGGLRLWLGLFFGMLRDLSGTVENADAMKVMAVKGPVWSGLADYFAGRACMLQGNWHEAATYLHKASTFQNSVGLFGVLRFLKLDQVELLANQGAVDEAFALVSEAINDQELPHLWSSSLRQRADLLVQSNADISTIEEAYRAAIECAQSQQARYYELQATTHFARWLNSQGRAAEAQTLLGEIYGWFTEGLDTPALCDAKALLDALTSKLSAPRRSNKSRRDPSRPV